ncbi:hypothetical protein NM208_g2673 [Fusarium decemcellulare]|uniref:Uncharacterized protein n=1 Tax=Fusarium decemcellulare TaxID=57161 RepID=A0ACC1SRZ6_9HYPO|nr:hypothetical protein NM208_g2673 [Fusarium decemcellulare]
MQATDRRVPQGALSLVRGATTPELLHLTFGQLLEQQAAKYGTKDAVLMGWTGARLSFDELNRRTKIVARGLLAMGVQKGDRVAVFSGDDERFIDLFFAAGRIGVVLVILNKTYTVSEVLRALKHTEPSVLFIADIVNRKPVNPILERLATEERRLKHVVMMRSEGIPEQTLSRWEDVVQCSSSVSASDLQRVEDSVDCHSMVNFQFTSGTTGSPKAVMLSQFNIINNGFTIGSYLKLVPEDVLCCGPPLFHCFGLVAGLMATFTHGAAVGFAGRDFDPAQVVDMLVREKCTALHGVPTMFIAVLKQMDQVGANVNTIRTGIAAGTKIPPALLEEVQRRLGYKHIAITYGMTETSPASFMTETTDGLEQKLETVGKVLPHVAAKVVDADNRILPIGARGELCISGYLLQKGYFKNPEKTAEVMIRDEDGVLWMHTGDEASIDEQGYCRITGRIKDIIIRGGENIYPPEIEERLIQHPSLTNASVVGVKDERYGEAVTAFLNVRPGHEKPSPQELRSWVQKELGRHKAPKHIIWVGPGEAVQDYPITGTGKIRKDLLRDMGNNIIDTVQVPAPRL